MRRDEFPIVDKLVQDSINDVLDEIRAELSEDLSNVEKDSKRTQDDIDCGICIGLQMALDTIDKYKAESEETETWNGIHAQITAPKGTFDKIWEDAKAESEE